MKKKKDADYFDQFIQMVEDCCKSAEILHETLKAFDVSVLKARMEEMHQVEHSGDQRQHQMMKQLAKEFLPPIEREDIILLSQVIDDVTDSVEDILLRIYMFDIRTIRSEALDFSRIIVECCRALLEAMREFRNFKKSEKISKYIIEVHHLEEKGDNLYTRSIRGLYTSLKDPVALMAWTETLNRFEKCCDACEHVAHAMEAVILKNT